MELLNQANVGKRRIAGVTVPLFSVRSSKGWGIGEIGDLPELGALLRKAGIQLIQLLPLGEVAAGESSPYMALTAFGIDPTYISLDDIPDHAEADLSAEERRSLKGLRHGDTVQYDAVRVLKVAALRRAFARFQAVEENRRSRRAVAFAHFCESQAGWLDDYSAYRVLKDMHGGAAWYEWQPQYKHRDPLALRTLKHSQEFAVLYYKYVQWVAHTQWDDTRTRLRTIGIELMGDLPFMVGRDSVDVWSHREQFRMDYSVGVPADQFDPIGQDWDLPPYYWERMRDDGFEWLRRRAAYTASLYDSFRIDHLVGFYRTYMRKSSARRDESGRLVPGTFDPANETDQREHGEAVICAIQEAIEPLGSRLIAEDLGAVPPFVRQSLSRLAVPGYKVFIWEKDDRVFRSPENYPHLSVACFSTHDTEPVAAWWENLEPAERAAVLTLPELATRATPFGARFDANVHRALFETIARSPSELVLFLIQEVLGDKDRINKPGTVGPHNWTYRMKSTPSDLCDNGDIFQKLSLLRECLLRAGRQV